MNDGCNRIACKQCGRIISSEVKVFKLVSDKVLKFNCPQCTPGDSYDLIKPKDEIIQDKNEIIELLKKKWKTLKPKS